MPRNLRLHLRRRRAPQRAPRIKAAAQAERLEYVFLDGGVKLLQHF